MIGQRVGPYEVLAKIGEGGMGQVCRARDTKLNRDVALKVLPDAFAADPDRMSRFQREAQLLAALNHPNIAAIYGLEDAGPQPAIVMELVEGRALAGPLPIADALPIARQIAEAIEYAHDRGIIHRDLKPANIKVTPDGTVKVLDFGLAKAMDDSTDPVSNVLATMSPTLSLAATHAGVILGTAAYMAPEQAKGKPADRRADIWAFGIVLYEIVTGAPVFGGDSVPETLASVMKDPIALGKLPDDTPSAIRKLVARCLERDPRRRLQSIGEARIVLEDVIGGVDVEQPAPQPAAVIARPSRWPWAIAGAAVIVAIGAFAWSWSRPTPAVSAVTRFALTPSDGTTLTASSPNASTVAVSPDGRYVAYIADEAGRDRTLWVRALDSMTAQRLDRTEGAMYPFWSPDSKDIAYFAGGKLMRVSMAGGSPRTICDAPSGEGGAWAQTGDGDGVIVFAPELAGPLKRVLAQGGVPTAATTLAKDEIGHSFPQVLPDGRRFLYLVRGNRPAIYVQTLGGEDRTRVLDSIGRAAFSPPNLLLYLRDNTLLAQRLNLNTLQLVGEPVSIAEGVRSGAANGRNAFSVSANGVLAYRGGGTLTFQVSAYTRDGKREAVVVEAGEYGAIALSPNDTRLILIKGQGTERDLWMKDLSSGVLSRLTSAPEGDRDAVWSPDGRRIAYVGTEGNRDVYYESVIGSGKQTPIWNSVAPSLSLRDWTPDGRQLLLRGAGRVALLPAPQDNGALQADAKPQVLVDERYTVDQLRVSPDGKWVAYMSTESGQSQVNLATFPAFSDRRQITSATSGASQPLWRADGKELFYLIREQPSSVVAVDVKLDTTITLGPPRLLFRAALNSNPATHMYAVTRDGQRFYLREAVGNQASTVESLYVVTNWTSLVAR